MIKPMGSTVHNTAVTAMAAMEALLTMVEIPPEPFLRYGGSLRSAARHDAREAGSRPTRPQVPGGGCDSSAEAGTCAGLPGRVHQLAARARAALQASLVSQELQVGHGFPQGKQGGGR